MLVTQNLVVGEALEEFQRSVPSGQDLEQNQMIGPPLDLPLLTTGSLTKWILACLKWENSLDLRLTEHMVKQVQAQLWRIGISIYTV
jgi:hypothetical protein